MRARYYITLNSALWSTHTLLLTSETIIWHVCTIFVDVIVCFWLERKVVSILRVLRLRQAVSNGDGRGRHRSYAGAAVTIFSFQALP